MFSLLLLNFSALPFYNFQLLSSCAGTLTNAKIAACAFSDTLTFSTFLHPNEPIRSRADSHSSAFADLFLFVNVGKGSVHESYKPPSH